MKIPQQAFQAEQTKLYVTTPFFISFEQDLVLSEDWWEKVPCCLDAITAIASGVRVPNKPSVLKKLQEYTTERYRRETTHKTRFVYGKTLDNTIYKTEIIRSIGGFPNVPASPGVDTALALILPWHGYVWKVNFDVVSTHLRRGLLDELQHYHWYGKTERKINKYLEEKNLWYAVESFSSILLRTGFSPIRGLEIAWKKRCWQIAYIYPLIRASILAGLVRGHFEN